MRGTWGEVLVVSFPQNALANSRLGAAAGGARNKPSRECAPPDARLGAFACPPMDSRSPECRAEARVASRPAVSGLLDGEGDPQRTAPGHDGSLPEADRVS